MEFPIKFDAVNSGLYIVYIEGSQVLISKRYYISFSEDHFCLPQNSAVPDEMPHYVAFCQGIHCLPRYLFKGFWSTMG